jgi:hypothetical protein
MAQKRCKRAQITLFLIIGVLMLFILGFLFYLTSQAEIIPEEATIEQSISQLVAQCLKKRIIESYAITGIDADRTRRYVDHELLSCADLSLFQDQADISHGRISSTVQVSEKTISAEVMLPITIKQGDSVIRLDSFNYHLPRYRVTQLPLDESNRLTKTVIARSADDRLELYLQQGTLAKTNDEKPLENITIHTRSVAQGDPTLFYYTVYDLQPHGAYFSPKARLSMKYVPSYNIENSLSLVKREVDSNFWKLMDSTPDAQRQMIETYIVGFSELGADSECESMLFVDTGELVLMQEAEHCSGDFQITLNQEDTVLCEMHLVDSAIEEKIVGQGLRMNTDHKQYAVYDHELMGLSCKDQPQEEKENCLHDSKVLETINIAINNQLKNQDNPRQVQFFVHINNSEASDCNNKRARFAFMIKGDNINCGNLGLSSGRCCGSMYECTVTDPILPPEEPALDDPEACGNKKGIMLHLQDTLLKPHEDYWPFLLEETKSIVGNKGWVLETVGIGNPIGNVRSFIEAAKGAGMRPIMRLMPKQDASGFDPVEFAEYAYDMSQGDDYFVQVCNEPNHAPDPGLENPCHMDAQTYAHSMIIFAKTLHELDPDKRIKILNAGLDPYQDSAGYAQTLFDYRIDEGTEHEFVFHDAIDIWASHAYDQQKWDAEMEVVSKENFPVILTEAGYQRHDPRYQSLCPHEGITKLFYNCLDPFGNMQDVKDRAKDIVVDDAACQFVEWTRCENFCKNNFPKCTKLEGYDAITGAPIHSTNCENCIEERGYTEDEVKYCCKECTYWCVIDDDTEIDWDNVDTWIDAQNSYAGYIQGKLGEWSSREEVIGIIPFLQIDGKELTGKLVKYDYECAEAANWRPYYWEYVEYRGEENGEEVPIHRACKDAVYPEMTDPYRYPVFDSNSGAIPTDVCPFEESGYDLDEEEEGTSTTPELPEPGRASSCITGNCMTLCLDASCSDGLVSWTASMSNPGCEHDEDFGDTFLDAMPIYDEPLECNYGIKDEEGILDRELNVLALIAPESRVTVSGFHDYGSGIHPLNFCLHCHTLEDSSWDEHDDFCVSTQIECG